MLTVKILIQKFQLIVRHGDMETWRHGDMETWRHGDMETWRHGDMGTKYDVILIHEIKQNKKIT